MLNIIRMDFARMMRSKSQYILWIVMAGLLILTTATMGVGIPGSQGQRRELGDDPGSGGRICGKPGNVCNNSDQTG